VASIRFDGICGWILHQFRQQLSAAQSLSDLAIGWFQIRPPRGISLKERACARAFSFPGRLERTSEDTSFAIRWDVSGLAALRKTPDVPCGHALASWTAHRSGVRTSELPSNAKRCRHQLIGGTERVGLGPAPFVPPQCEPAADVSQSETRTHPKGARLHEPEPTRWPIPRIDRPAKSGILPLLSSDDSAAHDCLDGFTDASMCQLWRCLRTGSIAENNDR